MKKILLITGLLLALPQSSLAVQTLYTPNVEEGQLNVEVGAQYYQQDLGLTYLDNYKDVQTELLYGFSDTLGIGLEMNGNSGNFANDSLGYRITGLETYLQFAEQDESGKGLSAGLRAEYELNHSGSDRVNASLLFDYVGEHFQYLINAGLYSDINGDSASDQDLVGDVRVGVRYLLDDMFQPGVEYYSDTGELDELNDFADQTNSIGPAVYGSLTNNFYYEAGYLYGLTDKAADNSYKFGVGYKIQLGN